jgi:hypothetical protein
VEERYLWAALGMLVALAIRLAWLLVRPAGGGGQGPTRAGKRRAAAWWIFGLCLLASLGHRAALSTWAWSGPQGKGAFYNWLRTASGQLPAGGQAAANEWHRGLFAAYWAGCPYLGQFRSHSPEGVAGELADYGATTVLVFQDDDLAGELRASPLFREEGSASSPTGPWSLAIFQFIPQPASAP